MSRRGVTTDTYVKGASQLRRKLSRIEPAMRDQLREALKAGGDQVAAAAKGFAPVDDGTLRSAIKARIFGKGLQVRVGFFGRDQKRAWYAHFVEFGTRAGVFKARRGKRASSGFTVDKPAVPAQPFMRPAASQVLPQVRAKIRQAMIATLTRIARGN